MNGQQQKDHRTAVEELRAEYRKGLAEIDASLSDISIQLNSDLHHLRGRYETLKAMQDALFLLQKEDREGNVEMHNTLRDYLLGEDQILLRKIIALERVRLTAPSTIWRRLRWIVTGESHAV